MADTGSHSSLSRRDFLRLAATLGGAAALASFLESCAKAGIAQQTPMPPTGAAETPTLAQDLPPTTTPVAGEPLLAATPTTAPTATAVDGTARVAFVKTEDRLAGVRQAIALLGLEFDRRQTPVPQAQFQQRRPPPGSTHPDVLRALVTSLNEMGAAQHHRRRPQRYGRHAPGHGNARRVQAGKRNWFRRPCPG